jgi:hypothetical protein
LTVFFLNINHNDGKGAFTLTLFKMTIGENQQPQDGAAK